MKFAISICHVSGNNWKGFQDNKRQTSRSIVGTSFMGNFWILWY